jgi:hypothetical protein
MEQMVYGKVEQQVVLSLDSFYSFAIVFTWFFFLLSWSYCAIVCLVLHSAV